MKLNLMNATCGIDSTLSGLCFLFARSPRVAQVTQNAVHSCRTAPERHRSPMRDRIKPTPRALKGLHISAQHEVISAEHVRVARNELPWVKRPEKNHNPERVESNPPLAHPRAPPGDAFTTRHFFCPLRLGFAACWLNLHALPLQPSR